MLAEGEGEAREAEALARAVVAQFENYVKLNKKVPPEALAAISQIDDPAKLADTVAATCREDRREAAAARDLQRREAAGEGLRPDGGRDLRPAGREADPEPREAADGEDAARVLPERADEGDPEGAGRTEDGKDEPSELEERIKKTKLSKEARDKAKAELKKLRTMSPMSAEATVVRNYLDWLLSIPWKKAKSARTSSMAQTILDADHYGLEKVKERILEYLAVQSASAR